MKYVFLCQKWKKLSQINTHLQCGNQKHKYQQNSSIKYYQIDIYIYTYFCKFMDIKYKYEHLHIQFFNHLLSNIWCRWHQQSPVFRIISLWMKIQKYLTLTFPRLPHPLRMIHFSFFMKSIYIFGNNTKLTEPIAVCRIQRLSHASILPSIRCSMLCIPYCKV
jgi:hypothetical protein